MRVPHARFNVPLNALLRVIELSTSLRGTLKVLTLVYTGFRLIVHGSMWTFECLAQL